MAMDVFTQSDLIEVRRESKKGRGGRGVFARRPISEGTLIERVPVLLIPRHQVEDEATAAQPNCYISWYVYAWGEQDGHDYLALSLGYGSLYNHSFKPNAMFRLERPDIVEFLAIKRIEQDQEITINYNGQPDDNSPVDFHVVE
jgi:uncharacterized protein